MSNTTITTTCYGVTTSEDCKDGIDMLKSCGGDFSIDKVQVGYQRTIPDSVGGVDSDGNIVPDTEMRAINAFVPVRSDTGINIADTTVGEGYTILQNREVIDLVSAICGAHDLTYNFMTLIHGGRGLAVQVACPDLSDALSVGDDRNDGRLTITNYHDGSGALKVHVSLIRMMCTNTLPAIGREFRNKRGKSRLAAHSIKHSSKMQDRIADMVKCYREAMGEMVETAELLRSLAGVSCSAAARRKFFDTLVNGAEHDEKELSKRAKTMRENKLTELQKAFRNPVNKVADASGSWYEALQAATFFGTHSITVRNTRDVSDDENRYLSKNFGAGATMNVEALELATQMAGV